MRINHNIAALNTHRQLAFNNAGASKSLEKLSSGFRINRAGDDAAGLAISEKMRGQIRGLDMAAKNSQDGISLIQTAEGALNETHSILQRMRELAVQSSTDTNNDSDRMELQKEIDQLAQEITRISNDTEFNQKTLLNGAIQSDKAGELTFHIGANTKQNIKFSVSALDAQSLGVARDVKAGEIGANTAGVKSTNADNVSKQLNNGTYTVTVADSPAVATATVNSTTVSQAQADAVADASNATAATNVTLTYRAAESATDSTGVIAGLTFTDSEGRTLNVEFADNATTGASITGNVLTITADFSGTVDQTAVANILSASTVTGITVTGTAAGLTATSTGSITGGNEAVTAAWVASGDLTGEVVASTNDTVNGVVLDVSGLTGAANGDIVRVSVTAPGKTAQLFDGTTAIGNAVTIDANAGGQYTIGDTTTGQMKVTFGANEASNGNTNVLVSTNQAEVASFNANGDLLEKAQAFGGLNISTQESADVAITTIQNAIETVSAERSKLGAIQNRLEHTINNLGTASENLTAAESRIRDVDMAKEMMEFTKNNILTQAAQAMLAQANQQPQGVLQLLR